MSQEFLAEMESDLENYESNVEDFEYRIINIEAQVKNVEMNQAEEEQYDEKSARAKSDMDSFKNETEMLSAMIKSFKDDEGDDKSTMDDVKVQNDLVEIAQNKACNSIVEFETEVEEIISEKTESAVEYVD